MDILIAWRLDKNDLLWSFSSIDLLIVVEIERDRGFGRLTVEECVALLGGTRGGGRAVALEEAQILKGLLGGQGLPTRVDKCDDGGKGLQSNSIT